MSDYEDVSPQEKVTICQEFIRNAPPGQLATVIKDVRVLMGDDDLLNKSAAATFQEYNTTEMVIVEGEGELKTLVSTFAEISPSEYLNPGAKKVVTFDHFNGEVTSVRDATDSEMGPAGSSAARAVLQEAFDKLVNEYYADGVAAVYALADGSFVACVSSPKFNLDNMWAGRWRCKWTISADGAAEAAVAVRVHYFEDGNVQMQAKKSLSAAIDLEDAAAAFAAVETAEGAYHTALSAHYTKMNEGTFKSLRRQLPVTASKFEWNKIAAYSLAEEMKN